MTKEKVCYIIKTSLTLIKIILLIIEIFTLKKNNKCLCEIIIFCFLCLMILISLIFNIIMLIFEIKKKSIKGKKCKAIILLIIDIINFILNLVLFNVGIEKDKDKDKESNEILCFQNQKYLNSSSGALVLMDLAIIICSIIILCLIKPDTEESIPEVYKSESSRDINADEEKLFIFEISNDTEKISIYESKTVNELLSKFKKKYKSKDMNLRFFWNNYEILVNNNITINSYFGSTNNNIIKVADKSKYKTFVFEINNNSKKEISISICIYETVEKLISKYFKYNPISKDKLDFYFLNNKIQIKERSSVEEYFFVNSLYNDKVVIKVKIIKIFVFEETPNLRKDISIYIDSPIDILFSKYVEYINSKIKNENINYYYKNRILNNYESISVEDYINKYMLDNNEYIVINVKIEKKFIFESSLTNLSEEIIVDVNENVESLLNKYVIKANLINNLELHNLYFFIYNNKIELHEKNTIRNYFEKYLFSKNIKIEVIIAKEKDNKKFIFKLSTGIEKVISFCIYESIEKLLYEFIKIINSKIDKNNVINEIVFIMNGFHLHINSIEKNLTIKEYFKGNMEDQIIIVYDKNNLLY